MNGHPAMRILRPFDDILAFCEGRDGDRAGGNWEDDLRTYSPEERILREQSELER